MKKSFFALAAVALTLLPSCQSEEQEAVITADEEVTVSFGMDLGQGDADLTRANHNFEYLIAISADAPAGGKIGTGYVGRFTSLTDATVSLKAGIEYTFHISAFETTGDDFSLTSVCATEGEFTAVTSPVSYAPDFADQKVDRYYGSTTQTIDANTTITVDGYRYAYGVNVNIAKPSFGHVTLSSTSPAFTYSVASTAADDVVEQNIYCMGGTDLESCKTLTVVMTFYDQNDAVVSTKTKDITIARNHQKTLKVNAVDPSASFDFNVIDSELTIDDDEDMTPDPTTLNGYDYVDLGLTDSEGHAIYWAACNIGANNPSEIGLYFAWGETTGYSAQSNKIWDKEHYKWYDTKTNSLTKYNDADGKKVLDLEDDAAHVMMGGEWRIPTHEEQVMLVENCNYELVTLNGITGCQFTSKINGNSIFLPLAGFNVDRNLDTDGHYWSSSVSLWDYSYNFYFFKDYRFGNFEDLTGWRENGHQLRAVWVADDAQ